MTVNDATTYNSRIYTDIQGLKNLKYENKSNPEAVKKEVAKQFESILMQMVLTSMRDANKAFASNDLPGGSQMDMYQDMFDKQLSLMLSHDGMGFAKSVEKNIDQMSSHNIKNPSNDSWAAGVVMHPPHSNDHQVLPDSQGNQHQDYVAVSATNGFASPEEFVKKLWATAKATAHTLGVAPEVLLAQSALETNWGKNILQQHDGASSHNLFNIKAEGNWAKNITTVDSLEQKNGVLVKEKSNFRSYASYIESFSDYANLLKQNTRYSDALNKGSDPSQFIHALQHAGYATDQNYADKILKIYASPMFQGLVAKAKQMI